MIGLIPRPLHAVLDYLWGIAFYLAPDLLGFSGDTGGNLYSKGRGGTMVLTSLMTRYELGVIRLLPFNMHLLLDFLGASFALAGPWHYGFATTDKAPTTAVAFSLFELGVVMLSKRDKGKKGKKGEAS
ncbi:MAG: hypothetical protein ACJ78Q_14770 [Chloroflexia bacterium]